MNDFYITSIQSDILECLMKIRKKNSPLVQGIELNGTVKDLLIKIRRNCRGRIEMLKILEAYFQENINITPDWNFFNELNGDFQIGYEDTSLFFCRKIDNSRDISIKALFLDKRHSQMYRFLQEREFYQYYEHWKSSLR